MPFDNSSLTFIVNSYLGVHNNTPLGYDVLLATKIVAVYNTSAKMSH
jgi:hypothetical protein